MLSICHTTQDAHACHSYSRVTPKFAGPLNCPPFKPTICSILLTGFIGCGSDTELITHHPESRRLFMFFACLISPLLSLRLLITRFPKTTNPTARIYPLPTLGFRGERAHRKFAIAPPGGSPISGQPNPSLKPPNVNIRVDPDFAGLDPDRGLKGISSVLEDREKADFSNGQSLPPLRG